MQGACWLTFLCGRLGWRTRVGLRMGRWGRGCVAILTSDCITTHDIRASVHTVLLPPYHDTPQHHTNITIRYAQSFHRHTTTPPPSLKKIQTYMRESRGGHHGLDPLRLGPLVPLCRRGPGPSWGRLGGE